MPDRNHINVKRHFLAPSLQNLPDMRIVLCLLLALSTATASAGNLCADALEAKHRRYFSELEDLANQEYGLRKGGYGIVTAGLVCLWKTRSFMGCVGLLGIALGVSQGYRYRVMAKMKALEDGYKLYEAYDHINRGEMQDASVKELLQASAAGEDQADSLTKHLVKMVDSGEICRYGAKVELTWEDVASALKTRKSAQTN